MPTHEALAGFTMRALPNRKLPFSLGRDEEARELKSLKA